MTVGLDDGFGEPLFAACFVFALIVRAIAVSTPNRLG
jgi:acid phosphatase family membrane protein YuiD